MFKFTDYEIINGKECVRKELVRILWYIKYKFTLSIQYYYRIYYNYSNYTILNKIL